MHILTGTITHGFGLAAQNLTHVLPLIAARAGTGRIVPGTLNVRLSEPHLVVADATIGSLEYDGDEFLKLQRCVVDGIRAVIVRPHKHETVPGWGHGTSYAELVSAVHLRNTLGLREGAALRIEVGGSATWWNRASRGELLELRARVRRYADRTFQRAA